MDLSISPFMWSDIATAILCGAALGLERQLLGKPAGIRTSVLICLGTYIFVKLGVSTSTDVSASVRIVGQVITGIGFLGAGVILTREGIVHGVTSAAVIWVLAAIGAVIGLGYDRSAFFLALLAIMVLVGVDVLENSFKFMRKGVHKIAGNNNPQHDHES